MNCMSRLKKLLLGVVRRNFLLSSYIKLGRRRERKRTAGLLQGLRILYRYRDDLSQRQADLAELGLAGCGHPGYLILCGRSGNQKTVFHSEFQIKSEQVQTFFPEPTD